MAHLEGSLKTMIYRYLYLVLLVLVCAVSHASDTVQFGGVKGKSAAVRISAIQMIVISNGSLEISTGNQMIRVKVDPKTESATGDLDVTVAAYFAILALIDGRDANATDEKVQEWMNISEDKTKRMTARMQALTRVITFFARVDCLEIDVTAGR